MKWISLVRTSVLLSLVTAIIPHTCTAQQKKKTQSCWDTAISQTAMNECAGSELKAAETKMAAMLKKLGIRSDDAAQRAWETYRDAQLESIYPKEHIGEFGSVTPMCLALLKKILTEGRIRDLKALTTSGEGDVCNGLSAVAVSQSNRISSIPAKSSLAESHRYLYGGGEQQ